MARHKQTDRPELTEKQRGILDFLKKYIRKQGFPPTLREIADEFEFAVPTSARVHLVALENKRYITRGQGQSRAIRIID